MKKFKILFYVLALGLASCQDNSISNSSSAENSLNTEAIIEETEGVLDDIAIYSESSFGVESSLAGKQSTDKNSSPHKHGRSGYFRDCTDIVVEEVGDTRTTTITFNGECLDFNGNAITGTITKVRTITDVNKERTLTIDSLSINGYVVNGTKSYTYTSSNANGNPEMSGTIDITVVTDAGTISKVGSKTIEITAGGDTDTCKDDEKTTTGSFVYTDATGATFSVAITTALVKPAGCRYIASGIKEYTNADGKTTIDYGDGTCDKIAMKTAPDLTVTEIKLGKKRHH